MSDVFLKVNNVSKAFAGVQALKNVNLTINKGEICCLAGENGSGKSTLIKIIAGAYKPDEGDFEINGKKYTQITPMDAIHEGIQIIYQDFSIFPNLTAAENIALNSALAKNKKLVNWKSVYDTAREAIKKINVDIDLDARVVELSVADKQLIAISRALLQNAKLIIMDEPTTALTKKEIDSLFKVIDGLRKEGISILFVSHKIEEVFALAEKITILRNGEFAVSDDVKNFDRAKFIYYMTGRELTETYYEAKNTDPKPVMKVENIGKKGYFADISFELHSGEILGITGLLGSGRTELALALFGKEPIDTGTIAIDGKKIRLKNIQSAVKHGIGYVPEDRLTEGLFLTQSIARNTIASIIDRLKGNSGFLSKLRMKNTVDHWVGDLKIKTASAENPVQTLSGGNQQRVVLAKWLATKPKVLILNGPTVGVDIGSKNDIHEILRKLADEGMAIVIISDDIPEVLNNCNRILIMRKGRIVGEFGGKTLTEDLLTQKLTS
jgi:simple sugar transport system ATP-binding protein